MTLYTKFEINDSLFATIQTIITYNEDGNVTTIERILRYASTNKVEKSFTVFKYTNQDRYGVKLEKKRYGFNLAQKMGTPVTSTKKFNIFYTNYKSNLQPSF